MSITASVLTSASVVSRPAAPRAQAPAWGERSARPESPAPAHPDRPGPSDATAGTPRIPPVAAARATNAAPGTRDGADGATGAPGADARAELARRRLAQAVLMARIPVAPDALPALVADAAEALRDGSGHATPA